MQKDEGRVVLRRGMVERGWHTGRRPAPTAPPRADPQPRRAFSRRTALLGGGALAACAVVLLLALSFRSFEAQGRSMEPRLQAGEGLVVARVVYGEVDFGLFDWLPLYESSGLRWGSPGRGDVIVFDSPVRDEQLVKRVVGLPGETISIRGGRVYIDGEWLEEPYAQGDTACLQTCDDVLIPGGQYFVLGDNRGESVDSRQGWTVGLGDIEGQVLFSY